MKIGLRSLASAVGLGLVALLLFLLWLWQPARQVALHQKHLLGAVEDRNFKKLARFLSPDYHDRWGLTQETAPQRAGEVFQHFFALELRAVSGGLSVNQREATVFDRLTLGGTGTFVAQEAMTRVNKLSKPFKFEWRRVSRWPWDWELVSVDQAELRIPEAAGFF